MLETKRKYKIGYKPNVCTISGTFFYIKKKDLDKYNRLKMSNRHKEKDKLVNEIFVYEILAVIDCEKKIPTKKIKASLNRRIWKMYSISGKIEDYKTHLKDIKIIMNHGKVNYEFDETIH